MRNFLKLFLICSLLALPINPAKAMEVPYNAKLEYNKGVDFYKVGSYTKAIESFKYAIKMCPDYIDAYYNLGTVLEYTQDYEGALSTFKQIIVRRPDDYESVFKAARLSFKLGEFEDAKSYLSIIPTSSPLFTNAEELAAQMNYELKTPSKTTNSQEFVYANGLYENISSPTGITADKQNNLYVAGFADNCITKITPNGARQLYIKSPKLNGPIGLAIDDSKNLYVANYNDNNVLKITPSGEVIVLLDNISRPYSLLVTDGLLFISSQGSNSIVRFKLPE